MADEQVLSERIKKMAEVATEYKLWGRNTANRSSLLNPLSTVFKNLRRMSPEMDLAFVKAQTIDDIFAHIGRVRRQTNPRFKIGQTKRNGITVYVEEFYSILEEVYGKKLPRVLTHEKAIEAAYLFFLSESMNVKNIESSEEEVKEAEPESGDIQ